MRDTVGEDFVLYYEQIEPKVLRLSLVEASKIALERSWIDDPFCLLRSNKKRYAFYAFNIMRGGSYSWRFGVV